MNTYLNTNHSQYFASNQVPEPTEQGASSGLTGTLTETVAALAENLEDQQRVARKSKRQSQAAQLEAQHAQIQKQRDAARKQMVGSMVQGIVGVAGGAAMIGSAGKSPLLDPTIAKGLAQGLTGAGGLASTGANFLASEDKSRADELGMEAEQLKASVADHGDAVRDADRMQEKLLDKLDALLRSEAAADKAATR